MNRFRRVIESLFDLCFPEEEGDPPVPFRRKLAIIAVLALGALLVYVATR
jgi:hypothetical protein